MAESTAVSPNIPDIEPDYVDLDPAPAPPPAADASPPEPAVLGAAHLLNAEILPAGPEPKPEPVLREAGETAPEPTVAAPPPEPAAGHREGECVPNVPDTPPDIVPDDQLPPPAPETPAADVPAAAPAAPRPFWLRWDTLATLLVVAVFGLLVFSQAISALALAATLPVWAQYLLLIPLGACCLAVLLVCANVAAAWFRLRQNRQIDLEALEELRRRSRTRRDGMEHFQEARRELEGYLDRYPLDASGVGRLRAAGVSAEACDSLAAERRRLLDRTTDSLSWLGEFREGFQAGLDRSAARRVRYWSFTAAGCVVASPIPLLDAALILGVAMKMIKDLCFIYNVRGGRSTGLLLLNRAIITAFIAGVAEDAANLASDAAGGELAEVFGESALGALGSGVAKAVAPKLGEGAINAFFINRLGRATVRLLQPLKPK